MNIELTPSELNKLVEILQEKYRSSVKLIELGTIKSISMKLGIVIDDWIPVSDT